MLGAALHPCFIRRSLSQRLWDAQTIQAYRKGAGRRASLAARMCGGLEAVGDRIAKDAAHQGGCPPFPRPQGLRDVRQDYMVGLPESRVRMW